MPLPGVRPLSDLVSRLLRPDQAARNARQAATEAQRAIREREVVEREVRAATEDP